MNCKTIALSSSNFITCGETLSQIGADKTVAACTDSLGIGSYDYWVIKTDSLGNKLWDNSYSGTGQEGAFGNGSYQDGFSLLPGTNDCFILAGTTNSPISCAVSDSSRGYHDFWILKIDSNGNKLWDKRYGGSGSDECHHISQSNDNGYMVCGRVNSPQGGEISDSSKGGADCWVLKLDSMGNKLWDKRYGGNKQDFATWIEKAPGGGYWISGQTASDSSGDVTEPKYGSSIDYWIFKIDESGNKLWDKRFGGPGSNVGSTFTIMPDGSIFLLGSSGPGLNSIKTDSGWGKLDYWIVHFKYTDSLSTVGINTPSNFNNNLTVFPNPTKDIVTITSATENIKAVALINLLGETLFTQNVADAPTTQLNLQTYASGFYLVKVTGANYSVIKKVLRQ